MGVWGAGNFENDGALDFVGHLMSEMSERVTDCFESEEGLYIDEEGDEIIMPSVEIMSLLSENCNAAPPKSQLIERWRGLYLKLFDEQIGSLEPVDGHAAARRHIIEATFDRLLTRSNYFWSHDSL